MRGVRNSRYREATRALQSGVPGNLRGCRPGLHPESYRPKHQSTELLLFPIYKYINLVLAEWGWPFWFYFKTGSRHTPLAQNSTSSRLTTGSVLKRASGGFENRPRAP